MDIHYISCGYCDMLRIRRRFPVYPFCHVMPFHLLPVNATDEPVKLIRCEMPCGITLPRPAVPFPGAVVGEQTHTPCLSLRRTFIRSGLCW